MPLAVSITSRPTLNRRASQLHRAHVLPMPTLSMKALPQSGTLSHLRCAREMPISFTKDLRQHAPCHEGRQDQKATRRGVSFTVAHRLRHIRLRGASLRSQSMAHRNRLDIPALIQFGPCHGPVMITPLPPNDDRWKVSHDSTP